MVSRPNTVRNLRGWTRNFVSRQRDNMLRPADQKGWLGVLIAGVIMVAFLVPLSLWVGGPYLVAWILILGAIHLSMAAAERLPHHRHRDTVRLRIAGVALLPVALTFLVLGAMDNGPSSAFGSWALLIPKGFITVYFPLRYVLGYDARAESGWAREAPSAGLASGIDHAKRGGHPPQPYELNRPRGKQSTR